MLGEWIERIATATHRAGVAWRARREAVRLRRHRSEAAHRLADALDAALRGTPEPEEDAWFARVEAVRARLRGSDEVVSFRDYGVPFREAPGDARAPFREVTRPVRAVCRSSAPPHEARVLFHLIRRFRPAVCLELGTCLGLSAAYQAAALACNGAGRLVTLEGGAALGALAERHLAGLDLHDGVDVVVGPFRDTLPGVLAACDRIDYAFLDGHHDPDALRAYFAQLTPHLAPGAVLVFDDVTWSAGMRDAWNDLAAGPRLHVVADLLAFGVGLYKPVPP